MDESCGRIGEGLIINYWGLIMNSEDIKKHLEKQAEEVGCHALLSGKALNSLTQKEYHANSAEKTDGPFYCPECYSDVILRKCIEKIDHFAHISRLTPMLGGKESELHDTCKKTILEYLKKKHPSGNWDKERPIPARPNDNIQKLQPDISGRINEQKVAIEIQLSTISVNEILKRTLTYKKRNIAILWVVPLVKPIGKEQFRPRLFERYLHSMYFGRTYYWWPDLKYQVMPVHYANAKREIPYAEWYEDGELRQVGGYEKFYKRIKLAEFERLLNIDEDFYANKREKFIPENEKKEVPACCLWQDNLEVWW